MTPAGGGLRTGNDQGWRRRAGLLSLAALIGMFAWLAWAGHRPIGREAQKPNERTRDFYEFYSGAKAIAAGKSPYAADVGALGYVYPPFLAWVIQPLAQLDLYPAAYAWLAMNLALLGAALWIASAALARWLGLDPGWETLAMIAAGGLAITLDKTRADISMGQSQQWMNVAWAGGLAWSLRRPWAAGLALAIAANIKYLTLAALPLLAARGRVRAAAWLVLLTAVIAALPAVQLGWGTNLDYLGDALGGVGGMARNEQAVGAEPRIGGISSWISCSITSAVMRWTSGYGRPGVLTALAVAGCAAAVLACAAALYRMRGLSPLRPGEARGESGLFAAEWGALIVLTLAFSPQTNSRHLAMLLIPAMVLSALWLASDKRGRAWLAAAGAVMFIGQTLPLRQIGLERADFVFWLAGGPSWCGVFAALVGLWAALRLGPAARRLPSAP